ncbi:23S rRNA (adenine2503-C2)-methyltransferase [Hydrogenivirga caldilitoris]|uniref:23S rRNA (Adenine2503-C2)-methyltransferase n=1 Tax=Hydrogenivirga caldilitoris TaxID=246264 RepID=A0A497XSN2_9AQUI|nr:radical SAM protein [Hydrogenivirga caldilitoris]RLJ71314.1 23S rRNA (adenine2503-C2)-methyltransferase [Hydrogenivirga caldilitoris]
MNLLRTIESKHNRLFIFQLQDGSTIEAVHYRGDTLCISTQVGCHVRCGFCASGKHGLLRNLRREEILSQYYVVSSFLPIRRIAVAGIGEPLANWGEVKAAFYEFKEKGLKVSFYTTGFPLENLRELLFMQHNGVSVSLHSLDRNKRKALMPYGGDLNRLVKFLKEELPLLPKGRKKKLSLAYLLIKDVNDSEGELIKLAQLAKELGVGVALLYYNSVSDYPQMSPEEYERAFLLLRSLGVKVTLSNRFRKDKIGGCGTLTVGKTADYT